MYSIMFHGQNRLFLDRNIIPALDTPPCCIMYLIQSGTCSVDAMRSVVLCYVLCSFIPSIDPLDPR